MNAIILAAGIGTRLNNPYLPKCLHKIGNETLIERHIRILKTNGIHNITTIIGKEGDCWTKNNIDLISNHDTKIEVNDYNVEYNRVYSFYCAIKSIKKSDLIIIDGDLVYDDVLLSQIIQNKKPNLLLARYYESKMSNDLGAKVELKPNSKIKKVGYDFSSSLIYSGIFKTGEDIYKLLIEISSKEENWNKRMSFIFNQILEKIDMEGYLINTSSEEMDLPIESENLRPLINRFNIKSDLFIKSSKKNRGRLINEINYLIGLPADLKPFFSKVINYVISDTEVSYTMPYYHQYDTFSNLIIKRELSRIQISQFIETIMIFYFNNIYNRNRLNTPEFFIRKNYLNKFNSRLKKIKGKSKKFDYIVNQKYLIINGIKMINAPIIIDKILKNNNLLSKLEPPFISLFHGDFRLGNILIDNKTKKFIFIDPRGTTPSGESCSDPFEDLAKLIATCEANYDLTEHRKLNINIENKGITEINISVNKDYKELSELFNDIPTLVLDSIKKRFSTKQFKFWEMRLEFLRGILLLALAPYKLLSDNNEDTCMILYVKGVEILNKCINKNPVLNQKIYNLININNSSDIKRAKLIFS